MRHLHWFQNDLRLSDHPLFSHLAGVKELLCVYLLPKPRPWCQIVGLGPQRDRVLRETLSELQSDLKSRGQNLWVLEGSPELVLPDLVNRFHIDRLSTSETPGYYEAQSVSFLEQKLSIPLLTLRGNTLFDRAQLPFALHEMPDTFTPFRKRVERLALVDKDPEPSALPSALAIDYPSVGRRRCRRVSRSPFRAGGKQVSVGCGSLSMKRNISGITKRRAMISIRCRARQRYRLGLPMGH